MNNLYVGKDIKISYIVVDLTEDAYKYSKAINKLRVEESVVEVRRALYKWHYSA